MKEYILRLDENTIVWWTQEIYDSYDTSKYEVIFEGSPSQCEQFINRYNEKNPPKISESFQETISK